MLNDERVGWFQVGYGWMVDLGGRRFKNELGWRVWHCVAIDFNQVLPRDKADSAEFCQ